MKLAVRMRKSKENLVPVKKQTADGVTRTYYVNPEQQISLKKPKVQDLPGQQRLFDGSTDGSGGHEGYFRRLYEQTESHVVQPLIDELKSLDAGLARRIADKYSDYPFDHDSKELDLKIDQATAYYMKKVKSDRENAGEWQKEYQEKTDRPVKGLNAKKRKALGLSIGSTVYVDGKRRKITGWSKRGFPKVGDTTMFFEEIEVENQEAAA